MAEAAVSEHWTRMRTLGRGASGAVVSLAADDASGELFAVKSACGSAATLRRERAMMFGLCSPHVLRCIGACDGAEGAYSVFLEYAPGGSLADAAARNGGRLEGHAVRAYAADVLRGLAYLHGRSVVHGDVKPRNVVIGADGRAKLADFGCARRVAASSAARPIGGTPAFMAPEVARGEEQGPAADVWALGCTVVEMATGRAPWSGSDVLAAVHRIGYTDAVPEVPAWMSAEAKDFLACCFARHAGDRLTAAQLLEHPFVAASSRDGVKSFEWVSPKGTLDATFWDWESSSDESEEENSESPAERIKALACSVLPDWGCDESWIDALKDGAGVDVAQSKVSSASVAVPAGDAAVGVFFSYCGDDEQLETEGTLGAVVGAAGPASVGRQEGKRRSRAEECQCVHMLCDRVVDAIKLWLATKLGVLLCLVSHIRTLLSPNFLACKTNYACSDPRLPDPETGGGLRFPDRQRQC
jgi:mitogen-activated protein kinase kinase kinase 17/18